MSHAISYLTAPIFHHPGTRLPSVRIVGNPGYAALITRYAFEPRLLIAARLLHARKGDFAKAEAGLPPAAWQLLDTCGRYSIFALADPEFSPQQELQSRLEEVPAEIAPLSSAEGKALRAETILRLRQSSEDVCKAAWTTVATMQRMRRDLEIAPGDPWWTTDWLSACLPLVPGWDVVHVPETSPSAGADDDIDF